MNCRVFLHGNGRKKGRITVFIFTMASSAVLKPSSFFEQEFDKETRCSFEGSWGLWIYVKCTCALTFPTLWGIRYAKIECLPFSYFSAGRDPTQIAIWTHTQPPSSCLLFEVFGKKLKKTTSSFQCQSEEQATHLHRFLHIFAYSYYLCVVFADMRVALMVKSSKLEGEVLRQG